MNIKKWFERGAMKCTTPQEAAKWFEQEVSLAMIATGANQAAAETVVKEHLGYATGYYPIEVAERIYTLWGVAHPFFGTPAERAKFTPDQLIGIEMACSKLAHGITDGDA